MEELTDTQIESIIQWMNTWEQLKDTAIPMRFKEDFTIMRSHNQIKKPPLGLVPKWVRDKERQVEIMAAISRYHEANKIIPKEWILEFAETCQ